MDAMGLPEDKRRDHRGHGQVAFRRCHKRRLPEAIAADQSCVDDAGLPPRGRLSDPKRANCAAAAARRMSLLGTLAARQTKQDVPFWSREMRHHVRNMHAYKPEALQTDTLHRIQTQTAPHKLSLLCRLEAAHVNKRADELRDLERRAKANDIRESLQDKKRGLGRAYAKLRSGSARPIGFLRGPTGRVTAHPGEVDAIVQEAWNPVYQGQAGRHADIVGHVLAKYKDYAFH